MVVTTTEAGLARAQTFSTRAAARILAVSPDRIRYWVKRRLLRPAVSHGRHHRFVFDDLLMMRLAKELLPSRRHLGRVRQCFVKARTLFDRSRPLTALKFQLEDGRIVVRDGDTLCEIDSGQMLLRFTTAPSGKVDDRFGAARSRFRVEEARRLAESDPLGAMKLYKALLARQPASLELHLELAAFEERQGDLEGALRQLLGAAAIAPTRAEIHLKLGLLYRRTNNYDKAVLSFMLALECDPQTLEAHRNLAQLYESVGRSRDALRHLSALNRLSRD
ncbi:MAG: MerR family transcriptional regulator [Candidatus Binataceae bacterium]